MERREFLKFSATGLTVVAVGSMADWPVFWRGSRAYASSSSHDRLELEMVAAEAEMVTGAVVPMWAFKIDDDHHEEHPHHITAARIPGPAMVALTGDRIRLRIRNRIGGTRVHRFAIPGVALTVDGSVVESVVVPQGDRVDIEFTAPAPGTYVYLDPENAPVNRMMGLHGVLVVLPSPVGNNTPYLNPTASIQRLFDDLGTAPHFPGAPWDPARNAIWVFSVIHSQRCAEAAGSASAISPARFHRSTGFLPDFFTINGKSGYFGAQHHHHHSEGLPQDEHGAAENFLSLASNVFDVQANVSIRGTVGQPMLIRTVNAGNFWHSPHIHGNHVYPLSRANFLTGQRQLLNNLTMLDTWSLEPGGIHDELLPYIQPPDIPEAAWPPAQELFPLVYPMHDHNEITNTAAGGNYPHGITTHWQIDGPFDPADPATGVIRIDRADLRVKTGRLELEGRFSVPSPSEGDPIYLDVHAGSSDGPVIFNRIRVGTDGRFAFRGRALKAITSRFVTMMHHDPEHAHVVHAVRTVPLRLR
jgi:hypothetical protein